MYGCTRETVSVTNCNLNIHEEFEVRLIKINSSLINNKTFNYASQYVAD